MDDDDWTEAASMWSGSVYDLRDAPETRPRLAGMRSVSPAAAWALHRPRVVAQRRAGFVQRKGG